MISAAPYLLAALAGWFAASLLIGMVVGRMFRDDLSVLPVDPDPLDELDWDWALWEGSE